MRRINGTLRVDHRYLDSFRVLFLEYSKHLRAGLIFYDVPGTSSGKCFPMKHVGFSLQIADQMLLNLYL